MSDSNNEQGTAETIKAAVAARSAKPALQLVVGEPGRVPRPKAQRSVPLVRVDADLDLVINECCREIANHPGVYQRNGKLVTVNHGQIKEIPIPTLRERLCAVASFVRPTKGGYGPPKPPNDHIVYGVHYRGEWGARDLSGISTAPFMRPDGTIFQTKGYDSETKFLYEPSQEFPTILDRPSIDDARNALVDLMEPLQQFPFREDDGRSPSLSAYVALLLTLMVRPAIEGVVPGWLISANTRGTGKTFLARIASLIAHGESPEPMMYPKDDEETRKKITSELKIGRRLVMFDNVKRPIGGEAIEIALTNPVWGDRELGTMNSLSLVNNAVFVFTGNNISTEQDASRRFIPVDLEATSMAPENRTFKIDGILRWTKENRPRLVAALLTVARAWWCAGRPRMGVRALGGYEEWSAIVPPILSWIGVTNPMEARKVSKSTEDTDRLDLVRLADWWESFLAAFDATSDGATVSGMMSFLYPVDRARLTPQIIELREDLESITQANGKADVTRSLAYRLRSTRRRVIDESGRFFDTGNILKGSPRWLVRRPQGGPR